MYFHSPTAYFSEPIEYRYKWVAVRVLFTLCNVKRSAHCATVHGGTSISFCCICDIDSRQFVCANGSVVRLDLGRGQPTADCHFWSACLVAYGSRDKIITCLDLAKTVEFNSYT